MRTGQVLRIRKTKTLGPRLRLVRIITLLRACSRHERQTITRLLEQLAFDPHRPGDYAEPDPIGRPVQALITGRHAICFWTDHAVREIKIVEMAIGGEDRAEIRQKEACRVNYGSNM